MDLWKLSCGFLLKILKSVPASNDENGTMHIIIQRPYDYLINELREVFGDKEDVKLKIDAREEERRSANIAFSHERRQRGRRLGNETLVEVIITA